MTVSSNDWINQHQQQSLDWFLLFRSLHPQSKAFSGYSEWVKRKIATFTDCWRWAPWKRRSTRVRWPNRRQAAASLTKSKSNVTIIWPICENYTRESFHSKTQNFHTKNRDYKEPRLIHRLTTPDMFERPIPNIPSDKLLAEVLHKCPDKIFKYHEHDSLLEKEDDLTEEEKENAWKRYEQEAKKHEIESQLKMSQETPPFPDSEPKSSELDRMLDDFNGNIPSKPQMDNISSSFGLNPELSTSSAAHLKPTNDIDFPWGRVFKVDNTVDNDNGIAPSSSAFPADGPNHNSIAANLPVPGAGKFRTNNSSEISISKFVHFFQILLRNVNRIRTASKTLWEYRMAGWMVNQRKDLSCHYRAPKWVWSRLCRFFLKSA